MFSIRYALSIHGAYAETICDISRNSLVRSDCPGRLRDWSYRRSKSGCLKRARFEARKPAVEQAEKLVPLGVRLVLPSCPHLQLAGARHLQSRSPNFWLTNSITDADRRA